MKIVDTHQHLWSLEQFPYSWCRGIPKLNRSFLLSDYRAAAEGTPITKTIFVEGDVDEPHQFAEARAIQQLATPESGIAGIVASGRPEHDDFSIHLKAVKQLPLVKGIRRVLHTMPDATSQSTTFVENIRRLADYDLTFDLCVLARQLPLAIDLAKKCPEISFVLDHCGIPEMTENSFALWQAHIAELGSFSNVSCKISGIVAYVDPSLTDVDVYKPWGSEVINTFGWSRVLWGSDWPVCNLTASLPEWLHLSRELVQHATPEQQSAFFAGNAERIYRLE
jgi:predicted TIM-barrel fold metal-dependent hydrolase